MDGRDAERPIARPTARVVVVDPRDRILLMQGRTVWAPGVWFTPGGGLEADENHEDAARRELWEETSLELQHVGPWVWSREHVWQHTDRRWFRSQERFYLARVPTFEPRFERRSPQELDDVGEPRWWTVHDIRSGDHVFAPRRLATLLPPLLAGLLPPMPIDVGL